jgi:tetratricopeptide (TPR) repeat protein
MKYLLISLTLIFGGFQNHAMAQEIERYLIEANEARNQMDFENAAALYTKVIELDSNNIEALYNRGWCANLLNNTKGIDDFLKVLELDSNHEGALHSLARSYAFLDKTDLADEYERRAVNPKSPSNLRLLARKAIEAREYEKAIELCSESIELDDEDQLWLQLLDRAEAYFRLGKYTEAITDFERCFIDYGYGMYSCNNYEMCGDSYEATGNRNKACEYWTLAVRNDDPEFDPASKEVKSKAKKKCKK